MGRANKVKRKNSTRAIRRRVNASLKRRAMEMATKSSEPESMSTDSNQQKFTLTPTNNIAPSTPRNSVQLIIIRRTPGKGIFNPSKDSIQLQPNPTPANNIASFERSTQPENAPTQAEITGRRILTVECINRIAKKSSLHFMGCRNPDIKLSSETRYGLQTRLRFSCSCGYFFEEDSDSGRVENEVNDALVWGAHSCGVNLSTVRAVMEEILEVECEDCDEGDGKL